MEVKATMPVKRRKRCFKYFFRRMQVLCLVLILSSCAGKRDSSLKIATAANMQFAMEELLTEFRNDTGLDCDMILGSSGALTAQIKEGAPFDVFVSADMTYAEEIYNSGMAYDPPAIYASGRLVLWSPDDTITPSMELLTSKKVNHIALANPRIAPYGAAAVEVLKAYGIYPQVSDKLVYGESIAQTNQFLISKSAEIGFTAKSVVLSAKMAGVGKWIELDESLHSRISQGIILIRRKNTDPAKAKRFYDFMFSEKAKNILQKFGYLVT